MSRVAFALLVGSAFGAFCTRAMADEPTREALPVHGNVASANTRDLWRPEIRGSFGFTEVMTSAPSPFGWATGLAMGLGHRESAGGTLRRFDFSPSVRVRHFAGTVESAPRAVSASGAPSLAYAARASAWEVDTTLAFSWQPLEGLFIRPGVIVAMAAVSNRTQVGNNVRVGSPPIFTLGPELSILYAPTRTFMLGIEGELRAQPRRIAAPLGSLTFVWGVRL
jgi:hypothetical protein